MILLALVACDDPKPEDSAGCVEGCDTDLVEDSGGDSAGDSADTGDSGDDSAEETGDSDETGDTAAAGPPDCTAETEVRFVGADGVAVDHTSSFLTGTYVTLDAPGTLYVCPATWFARVVVRADVEVVGLGPTPAHTVLSAGEIGTILDVAGATLTVSNLSLDRGAGLDEAHNSGGGGIYCAEEGTVVASDVVFSNSTANDGAGLYARSCDVQISGATFSGNVSEDDGGAFTLWYATATLDDVTFVDNAGLDGGAIALFYSEATFTRVTLADNASGHFAGAMWAYASTIALTDTTFDANVNSGADGGGLLVHGTATLDRVTFTNNAAVVGGGLFVYYDAVVTGTDCDFDANTPDDVWVADYSDAGGVSVPAAGQDYSFSCAASVCVAE